MIQAEASARARRWGLSKLGQILLLGLLIREAFSFWTGHPYDFEVWLRTGHAIAHGANPYSVPWPDLPGVSIGYLGQSLPSAAYLPFWPFLLGGLYRLWETVGFGNRFVLYLLVKQPGIWADVLTAYLIYRLIERWTGDASRALAAASFWSLFPYAIVITAIWGQFDSIVVALILAAWLVQGPLERNLLWGVGILIKWVTAIFLPLVIFRERGFRRLAFVIAVLTPVATTLLLFQLEGWSLTHITAGSVSQTSGGGYGMNLALLFSEPPLSGVFHIVPALYYVAGWMYIPGVFVAGWVAARWLRSNRPEQEVRALLTVVAVFLLL
ncbi:MAG: glycosyltransferase family 87 protein, partial [Thermoplasmata archaeon]